MRELSVCPSSEKMRRPEFAVASFSLCADQALLILSDSTMPKYLQRMMAAWLDLKDANAGYFSLRLAM